MQTIVYSCVSFDVLTWRLRFISISFIIMFIYCLCLLLLKTYVMYNSKTSASDESIPFEKSSFLHIILKNASFDQITMVLQRIYSVILCTAETKTSNNIITFRLKKYENILRIFHLCSFFCAFGMKWKCFHEHFFLLVFRSGMFLLKNFILS